MVIVLRGAFGVIVLLVLVARASEWSQFQQEPGKAGMAFLLANTFLCFVPWQGVRPTSEISICRRLTLVCPSFLAEGARPLALVEERALQVRRGAGVTASAPGGSSGGTGTSTSGDAHDNGWHNGANPNGFVVNHDDKSQGQGNNHH